VRQEDKPGGRVRKPGKNIAAIVAALAFNYSLVATFVLLAMEDFFADYDNQKTLLAWLALPIAASFVGWLAVSSPNHVFRILVWLLVLAVLFFCWIAIFSVGVYYLPTAFLMVMSVLGPWQTGGSDNPG
jgi:hypothetical protein